MLGQEKVVSRIVSMVSGTGIGKMKKMYSRGMKCKAIVFLWSREYSQNAQMFDMFCGEQLASDLV